MGYMRHHAICVTGWDDNVSIAHAKAQAIFAESAARVTEITAKTTNGHRSFFVAPDGSREWWEASENGERCRDAFINYLKQHHQYDSEDWALDWVEVQFGDDEGISRVTRHSDDTDD